MFNHIRPNQTKLYVSELLWFEMLYIQNPFELLYCSLDVA